MNPLAQKEAPMTIVAAMREPSGGILLGADSEWTEESGAKTRQPKLQRVPDVPIAWASAGNPQIGIYEFGQWAKDYSWAKKTWSEAMADASTTWASLNGTQRRRPESAGIAMTKEREGTLLSDAVLVGWLGNEMGMFSMSSDGTIFNLAERGIWMLGTGAVYAHTVFNTLAYIGRTDRIEWMEIILNLVISIAPNCGPPAECWRVTPSGIEEGVLKIESSLKTYSQGSPA